MVMEEFAKFVDQNRLQQFVFLSLHTKENF